MTQPPCAKRTSLMLTFLFVSLSISSVFAESTLISGFKNPSISCDYLIICPAQFLPHAERLATFRNTYTGDDVTNAKVVDLSTIEKEFPAKDSMQRCTQIWDAMQYARMHWSVKPKYLVLMGDDSVAIKGYNNLSLVNSAGLMPTCYFAADTSSWKGYLDTTVCYYDFYYRTITDSSIFIENTTQQYYPHPNGAEAAFSIGRIPAQSSAECSVYVDKVISFESNKSPRLWYNNTLLCADDRMQGERLDGLGSSHLLSSEIISNTELLGYFSKKVYLSSFIKDPNGSHENAKKAFFSKVNSGARWSIYFGHGHQDSLSDEGFLRAKDVEMFKNDTMPTMLFSFSCSNAEFIRKPKEQMCKTYLFKPKGGCISYFAASRPSYAGPNEILARSIFSQAKDSTKQLSLGQAVNTAFNIVRDDNMTCYHIMGDPALTFVKNNPKIIPALSVNTNGVITYTQATQASSNTQLNYRYEISRCDTISCIDSYTDTTTGAGLPELKYPSDTVLQSQEGIFNGSLSAIIPSQYNGKNIKFSLYLCNTEYEARFDTTFEFSTAIRTQITPTFSMQPIFRFTKGIVTVSLLSNKEITPPQLSIYDMQGRLCVNTPMQLRNGNAIFAFQSARLAVGSYFVKVKTSQKILSEKVFFVR